MKGHWCARYIRRCAWSFGVQRGAFATLRPPFQNFFLIFSKKFRKIVCVSHVYGHVNAKMPIRRHTIYCAWIKSQHIDVVFRKKLKKTFKKVLTKGAVRGIIVKRSRETAKNRKRKAWKESRLKESTGPWKLNNERKNGTCNFFERLKETYEKQNSTNLWRTSERRYERIKALKKIWARKRLDTIF